MKGKKPNYVPLKLVSLRLDKDVYDYLVKHYPTKMQATIRTVLRDYTKLDINFDDNGEQNDNDPTNF